MTTKLISTIRHLLLVTFPLLILLDALYCQFYGQFNGDPAVAPFNSFGWAIINWGFFWVMSTSIIDKGYDRAQLIKLMLITSLLSIVFRSLIVVTFSDVIFIPSTLKYIAKIVIISTIYGVLVHLCWRFKIVRPAHKNSNENVTESLNVSLDNPPCMSEDNNQSFENVSWVRACGNYVELFTPDSKHIKRQPIRELANQLINVGLVQVHRSFLVNKDLIIRLHPKTNGAADLELICGQRIPVSKRYIAEIKAIIANKSQSA